MSLGLDRVALCKRCPLEAHGLVSLEILAMCSRVLLCVLCVVVELRLSLAHVCRIDPQADWM